MVGTPVLLFDVMDTLVRDPIHDAVPRFFGLSLEELVAETHPTSWIEFEEGAIGRAEFYRRFFEDLRPVDGGELEQSLAAAYDWVEGMEPLVRELSDRGVEMHALSNYPDWFVIVDRKLAISRYVPWTFVSCRTRLRKPGRNAYLNAASVLGRRASDCLFIDDRATNCRAAIDVGMSSHVFADARLLRTDLEARGIL